MRLAIIERGQDVVGGINVLNGKKRVLLLKFPGSHADGIALLLEFGEILFGFHFREMKQIVEVCPVGIDENVTDSHEFGAGNPRL